MNLEKCSALLNGGPQVQAELNSKNGLLEKLVISVQQNLFQSVPRGLRSIQSIDPTQLHPGAHQKPRSWLGHQDKKRLMDRIGWHDRQQEDQHVGQLWHHTAEAE